MIRLPGSSPEECLNYARSLKQGDIPVCSIDSNSTGWSESLKEIAFKEDLFIAVENIDSLDEAYIAASNGAQFFILSSSNEKLMKELKSSGFFFIPKVSNQRDIDICNDLNIECVLPLDPNIIKNSNLYGIEEITNSETASHNNKILFSIIDFNTDALDYTIWINNVVKIYLGLNFSEVYINVDDDLNIKSFGEIFSSINKSKTIYGKENKIILYCNDFNRTISYLKWKNLYINPNNAIIENDRLIEGTIDLKLGEYKIIIKEKTELWA